ncbi:MAG: TolC family protein [Halobacteriovoraceae bacterium]|nr:TolC family protein [Halobacteriovoraceae bacterium]
MFTSIIKKTFSFFLLSLLATGCMKVDTNPQHLFNEVQDDISVRTGHHLYWDSSVQDIMVSTTISELLQKELTPELATQIALLNNRNLQAIYEDLGIAKAQLAQAGLLKNPIFSFSYRFSTQSAVTDLIDISLIQNFLEILLIPLKKKMAQAELEATKSVVMTQILDIIAETKIAFYTLLAKEEVWNLKKQVLLATELSYEAAQKLFKAGNIKDLEVSMERSLYEQTKLEVASWEIAVLEAREKLNVLMGLWGKEINWKTPAKLPSLPEREEDFQNIENDAIKRSVDLKIIHKGLLATAARFGIDTTKLVIPEFDAGISTERDDSIWYVGPAFSLALPLFDFGQANSAKAQAKIIQEWNQYTALAIEIRSKARSSRFSLLNAFRQSRYLEKVIVPLAEEITYSTLLQHNAMQLGIFHLLAAKREELEKKIQSTLMQQEYWKSKIVLQTLLDGHLLGKHLFEVPLRKYYE